MKKEIKVYELSLIVKLNQDIAFDKTTDVITKFLDDKICEKKGIDYHNSKNFKDYTFDNLIPFEKDKIYKKGINYVFRIRTINEELCEIFYKLEDFNNEYFKVLKTSKREVEKKIIDKLYTLTPALLKQNKSSKRDKTGYWLISEMKVKEFQKIVHINAIRKYQFFNELPIEFWEKEKDNKFFEGIKFKKNGVKISYKGKTLYTDKFELKIKNDELSQKIAYMLLGVGILQNNSRGLGFVVPRYFKTNKKK